MTKPLIALLTLVAYAAVSPAYACNTVGLAHIGSAKVDKIFTRDLRGAYFELKTPDKVQPIVEYFMALPGGWFQLQTAPEPSFAPLTFYSDDKVVDKIMIGERNMYRGGCFRAMSPEERENLNKLLTRPLEIKSL